MFKEPRHFITEMDIRRAFGVILCPAQAESFMSILLNTPLSFWHGCEIFTETQQVPVSSLRALVKSRR